MMPDVSAISGFCKSFWASEATSSEVLRIVIRESW